MANAYLRAVSGEDPELAALVAGARLTCTALFVREPGLLQGRAGLAATLAALGSPQEEVAAQAARLAWHIVHDSGALLVPGSHLLRFSADLATGTAGVLLALRAALIDVPVSPLSLLALDSPLPAYRADDQHLRQTGINPLRAPNPSRDDVNEGQQPLDRSRSCRYPVIDCR